MNKPGAIIIEGHVQGLSNTRALGSAGIPVYVVDKNNCIARYSKYCQKFFRCPDFILDEFALFLIKLAQEENLKNWVLIPSNDHAVYILAKHKLELERYYKLITPALDVIENIYDKSKLLTIAANCHLPIPVTQYYNRTDEVFKNANFFPVITKGKNGLSFYKAMKKKVFLANDQEELRIQLDLIDEKYAIQKCFTQELIPFNGENKTISFTAFCETGEIKTCWMGVKLREHPLRFGTATFAKSIYKKACYTQSVVLLKALNYTGVCEVEYLKDPRDGKYKLIEINARTWLWVELAKACGVDYAGMVYAYVNGIEIAYPKKYETGVCWINPLTDIFYVASAILKGQLKFGEYIRSVSEGRKVNAFFAKNDCKPGFAYFFNILKFLKNR